jgi:ISXO2-like transposase domain
MKFVEKRLRRRTLGRIQGGRRANVNQAESYFSRLRRAEIGQHHRISGRLLYQYANEAAWREDNRRLPNGMNWRLVIGAALAGPKSPVWSGYWHRSAA